MTSLTFGLIRDLPSRVDEDDEDVAADKRSYNLEVAASGISAVLIVCACKLSRAFSDVFLLGGVAPKCGTIKELMVETAKTTEVAQIYQVDDGLLVCHLKSDLPTDFLNDVAEKVLEVAAAEIIILHSEPLVSYKTAEDPTGSTVTRSLKSSLWKDEVKLDALERPNVVAGICAAIMTACEFQARPALLLANFSETMDADSVSLEGFSSLFKLSSLSAFDGRIPRRDAQEKLRRLAQNSPENLYL